MTLVEIWQEICSRLSFPCVCMTKSVSYSPPSSLVPARANKMQQMPRNKQSVSRKSLKMKFKKIQLQEILENLFHIFFPLDPKMWIKVSFRIHLEIYFSSLPDFYLRIFYPSNLRLAKFVSGNPAVN